ncbi:MAG: hypothetical protein CMJ81_09515 [Planctomycetaceae bacterium]|nr:hypothetical protein [Planctomycetaceae bacterium]
MPRKSVPSYRLHKPSGQARTIIDGRHIYLGKFNSPESRRKYVRLLAEMSDPKAQECQPAYPASTPLLLVSEVLVKYLEYAENYYLGGNSSSKEFRAMVDAVAPVNEFYGDSPADEFGPLKLKTLRQHLVEHGLCRTEINKRVGRIKRVFKWAVSEELISSSIHEGLRSVTGLKFGRTTARESEPVKPVEERLIDLTLPFTSPQVDAMVRLQLLTGMRPSEAATMQSVYIDRNEDIWLYEPDNHKNRWRGHRRAIPLGPRSQEIMKPFLDRPESQFLFSPAEAEEWRNEQRVLHRNRRTPVYPCELITREKRRKESRSPKSKRPKGNCRADGPQQLQ